ncbi:MAG: Nodulation protein H [Salinibacter sp.]
MLDAVASFVNRRYLVVRQQYRHLQALWAEARHRAADLPQPRFVLFGRGRSGTTALLSMLGDVPALDCEGEILHDWVPFPRRHVLGRCARSAGRGYGCKILSYQIRDVQTRLDRPEAFLATLHDTLGFQVLYLRRTHLLRHALSNIRARREQFHRKKGDGSAERRALRVDPDRVLEWIRSSERLRDYEHRLLEGIPHLSLTYEEHIRDASHHQDTVDTICSFLGVSSAPVESNYEKVAPRSLRDGVANYDELADRLENTPYRCYLE